jgi:hypothetical protein
LTPTPLSQSGKRGSGQQMKDAYTRLAGMCGLDSGAWWNPDCAHPHVLTLEEFMIMVIASELSPFLGTEALNDPATQELLANTAANWFSDSCLAHSNTCAGPTPNAIFNWMGENLESAQRIFNGIPTNWQGVRELAAKVVTAVLSVGSSPSYTGFNEPVHWGNLSYYEGEYGKGHYPTSNYMVLGTVDTSGKPVGNPFYVIPYAEEARMCGGWPC